MPNVIFPLLTFVGTSFRVWLMSGFISAVLAFFTVLIILGTIGAVLYLNSDVKIDVIP